MCSLRVYDAKHSILCSYTMILIAITKVRHDQSSGVGATLLNLYWLLLRPVNTN
jgi:hypothetical protein